MLKELKNQTNYKMTENGAVTYKTTQSYVLDLFSQGAALRNRNKKDIFKMVDRAMNEDALLTLKVIFWIRDIRGGAGERQIFRDIIHYLAECYSDVFRQNIQIIPEYGRWDDLLSLWDTPLWGDAFRLIENQLDEDIESEHPSLLAKWLPSSNTSSRETRNMARAIYEDIGWSERTYRKTLSKLRKKLDVLEIKLSEKNYDDINYEHTPSLANLKYRKAFYRNDEERYSEYVESVKNGEKKVNAKALFPYEIVEKCLGCYNGYNDPQRVILNELWKNLPDYIKGDTSNSIAVVDVSGSMNGTPMNVAISLGMYLAERNIGEFKNHFITFSSNPELVEIIGKDVVSKVNNMRTAEWGMSTNIKGTFDLILNTAVRNNMSQEEMPERIIIISDMEFDSCTSNRGYSWRTEKKFASPSKTLFEEIKEEYGFYGYRMPKLVFWNVDSRQDNCPMTIDSLGVQLVSGASPSIFESVLANKELNAYDLMLEVINKPRYDMVTI